MRAFVLVHLVAQSCSRDCCLQRHRASALQLNVDRGDISEADLEELAQRLQRNMDSYLGDFGGLKCPVTVSLSTACVSVSDSVSVCKQFYSLLLCAFDRGPDNTMCVLAHPHTHTQFETLFAHRSALVLRTAAHCWLSK